MSLEYRFSCPLRNGVHARPASGLARRAKAFRSEVRLRNNRTGHLSNVKSLLSLVGGDFRHDDVCVLSVEGEDQAEAFSKLRQFIDRDFANLDAPIAVSESSNDDFNLPPMLRNAKPKFIRGRSIVGGIASGKIVEIDAGASTESLLNIPSHSVERELGRLNDAFIRIDREMTDLIAGRASRLEAEILSTHLSMAHDPEFRQLIEIEIRNGSSAARAVHATMKHYESVLSSSASRILHDRQLDLRDVCRRLLQAVYGDDLVTSAARQLLAPSICIADSLTPQEFISLDRKYLKGLVMLNTGETSHTAILARSAGIPVLSSVVDSNLNVQNDREAILDADLGILILDPSDAVRRYYKLEKQKFDNLHSKQREIAEGAASTQDGVAMSVNSNAMLADDVVRAMDEGADGIGLLRSEWLYLDRDAPPSEDEQLEYVRSVIQAADGKRVVFRLLDVGGDKALRYLDIPAEMNPFLGYRGARIFREFEELIRRQIKAVLRAAIAGPVDLLIPMVSTVDEVVSVRELVASVSDELTATGITHDSNIRIGIMIEVPAAAMLVDRLAKVADFFSIGSNDLIQYFQAADRTNERVADLQSPCHPAVLRILNSIVGCAAKADRDVSICGEIAARTDYLPLLVGVGLRSFSVAPSAVARIKSALSQLTTADCRDLASAAMDCDSSVEVQGISSQFRQRDRSLAIIDENLVVAESTASSREEVIKELTDNLFVAGRTDDPVAVEEAVWERENISTTSVGYGIAIPHCKSDQISANSISILRLNRPIQWSEGGDEVRFVFMLNIKTSGSNGTHMNVLSQLARRIMQEEFREGLSNCKSRRDFVDHICSYLDLSAVAV